MTLSISENSLKLFGQPVPLLQEDIMNTMLNRAAKRKNLTPFFIVDTLLIIDKKQTFLQLCLLLLQR